MMPISSDCPGGGAWLSGQGAQTGARTFLKRMSLRSSLLACALVTGVCAVPAVTETVIEPSTVAAMTAANESRVNFMACLSEMKPGLSESHAS